MSHKLVQDDLLLGGEPRVNLMPPEVLQRRRAKATRQVLGFSVVGLLVAVLAGTGGASLLANQAQAILLQEQTRTTELLAEQADYTEIRTLQAQVNLARAAQRVGASTEVAWKPYLEAVQGTLPDGVVIQSVTVDSATPILAYDQPTAPLQGARIATVTFSAISPTLPDVPTWLDGLTRLTGFADALPGSVSLDKTTNLYTVDITMHVNDAAFAKRFETEQ
jgi:hypothetical protein